MADLMAAFGGLENVYTLGVLVVGALVVHTDTLAVSTVR
jgi:hypothetical protein